MFGVVALNLLDEVVLWHKGLQLSPFLLEAPLDLALKPIHKRNETETDGYFDDGYFDVCQLSIILNIITPMQP